MPLADAAKLFGSRPVTFAADLSPSGDRVVFLSGIGGSKTGVGVLELNSGKTTRLTTSDGRPASLTSCEFASDTMLVCEFGGMTAVVGQMVGFSRLVAIDLTNGKLKALGVRQSDLDLGLHQYDGQILDWLPEEKRPAVLMARQYVAQMGRTGSIIETEKAGGLGVDRIDLQNLQTTTIERPRQNASRFLTDGHGNVRVMGIDEVVGDTQLSGRTKFQYRPTNNKGWINLGIYDSRNNSGLWPVAVDQPTNSLYFLQGLNGRDALYRMKLDGSGASELVAKNDRVDIGGVIRIARGSPVIGYRYTDDVQHTIYTDPAFRELAAKLGRALPNAPLVEFAGSSRDGSKLLIHSSSDRDAGTYYLLDRASSKMAPILADRPNLDEKALAPVKSISFPAADRTMIPAYLTMSADGPATNRPTIVLPHGGPSSRDEWGFDWLAQFLASQGYAVIQPNYRGSAGYGDDFIGDNAFRDWKTAMSDIRDSAKYLVDKGIADPKRMAIVGWSYGGYAALQSAVTDPDRYKAVVAIAPVTDLSALRNDAEGYTNADVTKDFIGKGPNLQAGSPLHHASAIKVPVLLAHGDLDGNVRIAHSLRMEAALKRNGTPVELLRYKDLEHQLDDSDARTELLNHIGALLDRTIGH
jgi:acetyl esterase/lipase